MVAFIGFLPPFDMKPITLAGNLDDYWGHGGMYEDDDYADGDVDGDDNGDDGCGCGGGCLSFDSINPSL